MQDSFKKRLIRQLIITGISIILVVAIIIVLNIDINKRAKRIEERKQEAFMQTQIVLAFSSLKKEAELARGDLALLEAALPNRDELISLPRGLEVIAKKHEIDLGFSFGTEVAATETQPGSIRFTMSLGGGFDNLLRFMKDFELNPYYISLNSVDLVKREGSRFSLGTTGEIFTR